MRVCGTSRQIRLSTNRIIICLWVVLSNQICSQYAVRLETDTFAVSSSALRASNSACVGPAMKKKKKKKKKKKNLTKSQHHALRDSFML